MGYILNATVHVLKNGNEYVTSDYGMRTNPVSGTYSMHNGIDLVSRGSSSDDIAAYAAGVVSTVSYNEYRGYYVVIEHDGGFETLYQHLKKDSVTVKKGAPVSKGQKIAVMGSTGQSTGNHLHFEVHKNGDIVDPKPYLTGEANFSGTGGYVGVTVIKRGDSGVQVTILQGNLNSLGFTVEIDGSYGPATEEAVKSFQSSYGLDADGRCGPATSAKMAEAIGTVDPSLKRGDSGADVTVLQGVLRKLGYAVEVDGSFGPATEEAVKSFQMSYGLAADGKCGPETSLKLSETL